MRIFFGMKPSFRNSKGSGIKPETIQSVDSIGEQNLGYGMKMERWVGCDPLTPDENGWRVRGGYVADHWRHRGVVMTGAIARA
jgi:hypothetical protein